MADIERQIVYSFYIAEGFLQMFYFDYVRVFHLICS